jgi:hypothetical protein
MTDKYELCRVLKNVRGQNFEIGTRKDILDWDFTHRRDILKIKTKPICEGIIEIHTLLCDSLEIYLTYSKFSISSAQTYPSSAQQHS